MMGYFESPSARQSTGTGLSVTDYTTALLEATDPSQLNGQSYELDNSGGDWDETQADGDATFSYVDHATNVLYVVHANYVGPQITTSLGALPLSANALNNLHAQFSGQRQAMGLAPLLPTSYTLIILGVALLAAATLVAIFAPETTAWVWIFRVGLAVSFAALTAGIAYAVFAPTLESTTCNANSTSCCSLLSGIGGANEACVDCTGTSCQTTVTPVAPSLGTDLLWIALGLGAVAAVGVGGYVAYRYVTNRPRPGYGNAPPLRERYPAYGRLVGYTPPPPPTGT